MLNLDLHKDTDVEGEGHCRINNDHCRHDNNDALREIHAPVTVNTRDVFSTKSNRQAHGNQNDNPRCHDNLVITNQSK